MNPNNYGMPAPVEEPDEKACTYCTERNDEPMVELPTGYIDGLGRYVPRRAHKSCHLARCAVQLPSHNALPNPGGAYGSTR